MKEYIKTDQQIHWLSQIIAKANRTFVSKKADDSHTNLYFDPLGNRILGRWIARSGGNIILTLNLSNLQFEWLDSSHQTVQSHQTIGKTMEAVEGEVNASLTDLGLSPDGFRDTLHYDLPDYSFAMDVISQINEQDKRQWKYYRDLANQACSNLLDYLQIEGEVRIWPHHFDTGIFLDLSKNMGIGFGMAMADSLLSQPYFYMSGYATNDSVSYANLPDLKNGNWILSEHWKGAVLPLNVLKQIPDTIRFDALKQFMLASAHWFMHQN